jgi:hypothetical protein
MLKKFIASIIAPIIEEALLEMTMDINDKIDDVQDSIRDIESKLSDIDTYSLASDISDNIRIDTYDVARDIANEIDYELFAEELAKNLNKVTQQGKKNG